MPPVQEVNLASLPLERFRPAIGGKRMDRVEAVAAWARTGFSKIRIWNVNSTARGGGVAEILSSLLPYARDAGVDARWLVIEGDPEFYAITKRIHNGLHGLLAHGEEPGEGDHPHYAAVSAFNAVELRRFVRPGDLVILHDPQTAGLVLPMFELGALVIWRCHIGHDDQQGVISQTWEFLRQYVGSAHGYVFSRDAYAPPWIDRKRTFTVAPSIDPFSSKNYEIPRATVHAILRHVGLVNAGHSDVEPIFRRHDGAEAVLRSRAEIASNSKVPGFDTPLVVQVSRWDRLKDMVGVMQGFAAHLDGMADAHLALVGPDVSGVSDDPEGAVVFDECIAAWKALPPAKRSRVHLVSLPMQDLEENAAIVNAIQRHAAVVVQKSLYEGFGLTVTEAMWKGRPIVASRVGGIQDQIKSGTHGLLLDDPKNLKEFGDALQRLLGAPVLARRLGRNARRRAIAHFLGVRQLIQYVDIFRKLTA